MAATGFKIYSLLLVKNEADIIAAQLRDACRWSDRVIVLDNGSTDGTWQLVQDLARQLPQVVPFGQYTGPFRIGLRARLFKAFRHQLTSRDWWCVRLDADEFYPGDVRAFLASVPRRFTTVSKLSTDYLLSEDQLDGLTGDFPTDRRQFTHFLPSHRRERRFMRHSPWLVWPERWRYPHPWGREYPEGIPVDHYQYRSVAQMQQRFLTRQQAKADGCGTFRHEDGQGWQDYLWDRHRFSWQDRFLMADRVLKTGRNEIRLTDDGVVIKSFAVPRGWKRLLYTWLRASKACRSYRIAQRLGDRTPQPLGYQELHRHGWLSHSYYACRLSDCPYTFKDLRQPDFPDRERHFRAIARFTARLHEEGILHTDYSQGNILFNEADRIQLVDLNRIRFLRRIGINKGIRNFSRLHLGDDYAYGIMIDEYKRARNTKI